MILHRKFIFTGLFGVLGFCAFSQKPATVNDSVADFAIPNILNYHKSSSSFSELNSHLLVVDFFGTWCVPCLKALPKLSTLQQQFKNEITIMLVSEEKQEKLEFFLRKQGNFRLPVVVDINKNFEREFQPPAYPYTIIVGKNGHILAIPSQEEMNEENIKQWLKMQEREIIQSNDHANKPTGDTSRQVNNLSSSTSRNKLVQLSQDFLYAAKTGEETGGFLTALRGIRLNELASSLKPDDEKKAFWINLYNAFTQVTLSNHPDMYKQRGKFFSAKRYVVAGRSFSLDDIEHGFLRRSTIKWSLGYLNKPFPGKTEKLLRVNQRDYRIHFALNCGAKSCPPIAFYKPENLDAQLDLATRAYLSGEVEYDPKSDVVRLPKLMSWFRRDFGGKKHMIYLLKKLSLVPVDKFPTIRFKPYDWTLFLQHYKS